jgi:hypothetical protein
MFIAFLYMFRATMCPSSEEKTVPPRHLVFVTLYRCLSDIQGEMKLKVVPQVGSVYKMEFEMLKLSPIR